MAKQMLYADPKVSLDSVELEGEPFYKISNVDGMRPFFMNVVSDSNHWLFISSNGGLTAGRKNSEFSFFPYYTDDKITESSEVTGSKSVFQVSKGDSMRVWEPFSKRQEGVYAITRNLYKNRYGNKILFEERNDDLELVFQYQWNFSNEYGLVKKSRLMNESNSPTEICLLDGMQNIVPYGVPSDTQTRASNLTDAYKRSELEPQSGLGIFALSAIIVDKAEPSEALKANVAFSAGLTAPVYLLSSLQLDAFRKGGTLHQEEDIKAEKGAYFVSEDATLDPGEDKQWMIVGNVNQDHAAVVRLIDQLSSDSELVDRIQKDIDEGTANLVKLTASADGIQRTGDSFSDARHFSNVLFNIMRGGIFDDNYRMERWDFLGYLENANRNVYAQFRGKINQLGESFTLFELNRLLEEINDPDCSRLSIEYLPLKFSRRHGDPSRPWNKFSINTRNEVDGSKILDYEGNWRDIFQNWEALAHSYPAFIKGMIYKFLNASTFDGYNPYRVTKGGFDWEIIEPDDPWSYIGYWGDHQIIYLLKFLEFAEDFYPDMLTGLLDKEDFVYAYVPYTIKPHEEICKNPKDTIDFDVEKDELIRVRRDELGADGALFRSRDGRIVHVNFTEKILATSLAKVSNFILEGGIWMNTQRPEWNDANNALVGNGISMVTLNYLHRFMQFLARVLDKSDIEQVSVTAEMHDFFHKVLDVLASNSNVLLEEVSDRDRKKMLDQLGEAASEYRWKIYKNAFGGNKQAVELGKLRQFVQLCSAYFEHSIKATRRKDGLFHGYNLVNFEGNSLGLSYLDPMLEGQVAVLSSGQLNARESLEVLKSLKSSAMYREDQQSYMLYPNKALPGFLQKNKVSKAQLKEFDIKEKHFDAGASTILRKDINGDYHFDGNFRNAGDLEAALNLDTQFLPQEREGLLKLFEEVFNHKAFTGRSGTFYGYEGLGSIYWHMVSKLRLAVQESVLNGINKGEDSALIRELQNHYYEITEGIGVHKSPVDYGAFPTDPYSHTPFTKGAQQPGMTGQVKEDVLSRWGELGVFVRKGSLHFQPAILRRGEFLSEPETVQFYNIQGKLLTLDLEADSLFFTWCQVPVVYTLSDEEYIELESNTGQSEHLEGLALSLTKTQKIINRTGEVRLIKVGINSSRLLHE